MIRTVWTCLCVVTLFRPAQTTTRSKILDDRIGLHKTSHVGGSALDDPWLLPAQTTIGFWHRRHRITALTTARWYLQATWHSVWSTCSSESSLVLVSLRQLVFCRLSNLFRHQVVFEIPRKRVMPASPTFFSSVALVSSLSCFLVILLYTCSNRIAQYKLPVMGKSQIKSQVQITNRLQKWFKSKPQIKNQSTNNQIKSKSFLVQIKSNHKSILPKCQIFENVQFT